MSEFLLALEWLRKQSNIQHEISEIKDEENRQDHSVDILYIFFLQRIFYSGSND